MKDWNGQVSYDSVKELETTTYDKKTKTFTMCHPDGWELARSTAEQAVRFAKAVKAILAVEI